MLQKSWVLSWVVIWFSWKSLSGMILFCSLLDQSVGMLRLMGFQHSDLMQFDSLIFQQRFCSSGFNGFGTLVLSLIFENSRSRFMLELMLLLCRFWVWNPLLDLSFFACLMMVKTILLFLRDFFWRSVRMLDTIVFSGLLSLFSPAWDAVKLVLPRCWLHLSFRCHWPCRFRSDDGSCLELAPGLMFDHFLPIPDAESRRRIPAFFQLVLKLVVGVRTWISKPYCRNGYLAS